MQNSTIPIQRDGNKVDKLLSSFPKPSITGATLTSNYVDENGTSVQDPVTEWVGFIGEKFLRRRFHRPVLSLQMARRVIV